MGRSGGEAPSGARVRWLKTLYLRAPSHDWPELMHGGKREFRMANMGVAANAFYTPTPVVLYATGGGHQFCLMVLTDHRKERLIDADSPESLALEGFNSYDEFRAYWRRRTRRPYDPAQRVEVFRIEPWQPSPALGNAMIERLYGDYLLTV